eukprot:TRINITY_DN46125_c0_g1_i1.p1 TRINITY_DN46125_c0_g1~~TRINITY_DN46125_c0_g1_i1.p1  ORF type:complete len:183 (-),score=51.52 TRINITY_DN46125_c0_g1_i1:88-636(-)
MIAVVCVLCSTVYGRVVFFFKQKTAYEMLRSLVGSEMCIRDRATIARFGFISGFTTCAVLYSSALLIRRTYHINPNAVYNQSIALALKHPEVQSLLGTHPKTGEFRAYCATGGFKLPLMRRIRSGSYEIADLLALRPRRLQMIFFLKNTINGKEGMVTVDVQKESTGTVSYTHLTLPTKRIV